MARRKKGICSVYSKLLRERERARKIAERAEEEAQKGKKKKDKAREHTRMAWEWARGARAGGTVGRDVPGGGEANGDGEGAAAQGAEWRSSNGAGRGRNVFRGKGAPVRTNWRGTKRPDVLPAPIPPSPKKEETKRGGSDSFSDTDDEDGPSANNVNVLSWADESEKKLFSQRDGDDLAKGAAGRKRRGRASSITQSSTTSGWGTISEGPW